MEQVIGFLIILALIVFFLPVSNSTKIKRLNKQGKDAFIKFKVEKILTDNWYKNEYLIRTMYGRHKIKTFICFGYTDIKDENKL